LSTALDHARWALCAAVACTCIGEAARMLIWGGPVLTWLWQSGWTEQAALRLEGAAAFALIACIGLIAWRNAWPAALVVAGWMLFSSIATAFTETAFAALAPGGQACRWLAPVALAFLSRRPENTRAAEWLLRAAAAATFACHGLEAMLAHPPFIDLLIGATRNASGPELAEGPARVTLGLIGLLDLLLAVAILLPLRVWPVAIWMSNWGLLTAIARGVYLGSDVWPEVVIRLANGLTPLTVCLLWRAKLATPQ
jgi:hypothetical protein